MQQTVIFFRNSWKRFYKMNGSLQERKIAEAKEEYACRRW